MRRRTMWLLTITTAVLLLLVAARPLLTRTAANDTDDQFAYLPLVLKNATTPTPAPPPIPVTPPTVHTTTVTIPSYDLEAGFIATQPGDFVYPYPRLNHDWVFQRPKITREMTAVVLENSYVRITILPELGGRLYRWEDKVSGRRLLYENPILKPTQWGWRGWWLATGGIEWAFPTDEHGLNEWRAWDHAILTGTNVISVTVSDVESKTGMTVGATIALDGAHSAMTLQPWVENNTAQTHSYQYWLNAMIALHDNDVSPQTEFIAPATEAVVHSTGDPTLPAPHGIVGWPVHNGRLLSDYSTWTDYFGFFVPDVTDGFTGVYDHAVNQGVVRVFDPARIPGHKFFGPADLSPNLWTDDGSGYVEMWSSGVTSDFWTYVEIAPGARISWTEQWYPVRDLGGFDVANEHGVMRLVETSTGAEMTVATTAVTPGTVQLLADGAPVADWQVEIRPERPFVAQWQRPSGVSGTLSLRLLDADGGVLIEAGGG